jgi:hypothetical protein
MDWPTPQDYSEAVQNPRLAFGDPELQAGRPELDRLGLPRPRSGSFATVYKIECAAKNWAVRCFLRNVPDQQQRYAAIFNYLDHTSPSLSGWFQVPTRGDQGGKAVLPPFENGVGTGFPAPSLYTRPSLKRLRSQQPCHALAPNDEGPADGSHCPW